MESPRRKPLRRLRAAAPITGMPRRTGDFVAVFSTDARMSRSVPEFPSPHKAARLRETQSTFNPNLFNPDLTLLKSLRNALRLTYSHWGGTDHEELKSPGQRRGTGSSISSEATPSLAASRSRALPTRYTARLKSLPEDHLPITSRGRLFPKWGESPTDLPTPA